MLKKIGSYWTCEGISIYQVLDQVANGYSVKVYDTELNETYTNIYSFEATQYDKKSKKKEVEVFERAWRNETDF